MWHLPVPLNVALTSTAQCGTYQYRSMWHLPVPLNVALLGTAQVQINELGIFNLFFKHALGPDTK